MCSVDANFLNVLADASSSLSVDDMNAVVFLAKSALRAESHIDVFIGGRFWEAKITRAERGRFRYRFTNTRIERGWIFHRDFLETWRFPVRTTRDLWKADLMAIIEQ